jgi:hypothetical protein
VGGLGAQHRGEELTEDEVFTEFDFLHVRGVEFDDVEVLSSSRRL